MSLSLTFNKKKALINKLHYDARRVSLLYARILFRRFDKGTYNNYCVSSYVTKFDNKKGKFVDMLWQTKLKDMTLRVVRTNKNKYFIYEKNIISFVFMWFYVFILNLLKK